MGLVREIPCEVHSYDPVNIASGSSGPVQSFIGFIIFYVCQGFGYGIIIQGIQKETFYNLSFCLALYNFIAQGLPFPIRVGSIYNDFCVF